MIFVVAVEMRRLDIKTCGEWVERECSVDSSSLENSFHNEVVRSVNPEWVVAESLSENAVTLLKLKLLVSVLSHCEVSTFDHVVLRDALTPSNSVGSDVLDTFLEYRPDPNTDIGGHDVHETKSCKTFELVDIQLKK